MEVIKVNRAEHTKYGLGWVIKDIEVICREHECLFMPDNGVSDRTNFGYGQYAHFVPAKFDIFDKEEITIH